MSFGFVNIVIVLHNRNEARSSQSDSHKNSIYYDKTHELQEQHLERNSIWRKLFCCKRDEYTKVEIVPSKAPVKADDDITYDELQ